MVSGELSPAAVRRHDQAGGELLGEGGDQVQPPAAQPLLSHQHPYLLLQSQSHAQIEYIRNMAGGFDLPACFLKDGDCILLC